MEVHVTFKLPRSFCDCTLFIRVVTPRQFSSCESLPLVGATNLRPHSAPTLGQTVLATLPGAGPYFPRKDAEDILLLLETTQAQHEAEVTD